MRLGLGLGGGARVEGEDADRQSLDEVAARELGQLHGLGRLQAEELDRVDADDPHQERVDRAHAQLHRRHLRARTAPNVGGGLHGVEACGVRLRGGTVIVRPLVLPPTPVTTRGGVRPGGGVGSICLCAPHHQGPSCCTHCSRCCPRTRRRRRGAERRYRVHRPKVRGARRRELSWRSGQGRTVHTMVRVAIVKRAKLLDRKVGFIRHRTKPARFRHPRGPEARPSLWFSTLAQTAPQNLR